MNNPTHPTRRAPSPISPALDPLEPRRLLSAAIDHRTLVIEGTPRADTIVVTNDSPKTLRVRIGDAESTFLKRSFSRIRITAGRGDDLVTVGSDANPVALPTTCTGNDGDDTLIGAAAADNLSGGAGADQVTGAAGDDTVSGDNGNDDLHGGDGDDTLIGGRGDDHLHDDAGDDKCSGNTGTDLFYYDGSEAEKLRDAADSEKAYAEPAFNIKKRPHAVAVLNNCPLDLVDGRHVDGGLIRAGGSTLVVAGPILKQWRGPGLETSSAKIPHFDLPGGGYLGGVGSLSLNATGSILTGSVITNYTGATITGAGAVLTRPNNNFFQPTHIRNDTRLSANAGTVITYAGANTHTLLAGETLTLTGPASIKPAGLTLNTANSLLLVDQGVTITITGSPTPASPVAAD